MRILKDLFLKGMRSRIFKTVYFDIAGFCNAMCAYCLTGEYRDNEGKWVDEDMFDKTVTALIEKKLIDRRSVLSLYNWGEPFLHPELDKIIKIANRHNIRYAFSTNASRLPAIDDDFVKNLDHIIFSMCGFSQESYDKIQKLDFEKAKSNIVKTVTACRSNNFKGDFRISYHVYRFNHDEIKPCEEFANSHNIVFYPYNAILNRWDDLKNLVDGEMDGKLLRDISKDLMHLEDVVKTAKRSPDNYRCPQEDLLIIAENGDIVACCQLPKHKPEFLCGNVIVDDARQIFQSRRSMSVCNDCIRSGLAYYINTSIVQPDGYRFSLKQRYLRLRSWQKVLARRLSYQLVKNEKLLVE